MSWRRRGATAPFRESNRAAQPETRVGWRRCGSGSGSDMKLVSVNAEPGAPPVGSSILLLFPPSVKEK